MNLRNEAGSFRTVYDIQPPEGISPERFARGIAIEQTVELDEDLIDDAEILDHIVGHIHSLEETEPGHFRLTIDYNYDVYGGELLQFLNVLFGNISLKAGIDLVDATLEGSLFSGPKLGIQGIRQACGEPQRPLLCTALKPMGSSLETLSDYAYKLAAGGLHVLKDDHGLANQPRHPAAQRIPKIAAAIDRAAQETGQRCFYFPHFLPKRQDFNRLLDICREAEVPGLLVCPLLLGFETVHYLANHTEFALMGHPAWTGGYFRSNSIRPSFLLGKLNRALGIDASVYPNVGGRFSFSLETCHAINHALRDRSNSFKASFPVPGGGMTVQRIPELVAEYGNDFIMLMGSGLYRLADDLGEATQKFRAALYADTSTP